MAKLQESKAPPATELDLCQQVRGNELAKRVVLVAVAGRHSLSLVGAPGTGKSMLARVAEALRPESGIIHMQWPCPCGYFNVSCRVCNCSAAEIGRFRRGWPRTQLFAEVVRPTKRELMATRPGTGLADMREHLASYTSQSRSAEPLPVQPIAVSLLGEAYDNLGLVPAEYYDCLAVAQTIARLAGADSVLAQHIAEAVNYRPLTLRQSCAKLNRPAGLLRWSRS